MKLYEDKQCEFPKLFYTHCYRKIFKNREFICFSAPPKKSALDVGWINPKILNVTCQAIDIYPEPQLNIRITTHQR